MWNWNVLLDIKKLVRIFAYTKLGVMICWKLLEKYSKSLENPKKMSLKEVAAGDISVAHYPVLNRGVNGITLDSFYCCLKKYGRSC